MSFSSLGVKYKLERSGLFYSDAEPFYEVIAKVELTENIIEDTLDAVDEMFDNLDGNNVDKIYDILKLIQKSSYANDEKYIRQIYFHMI